MGLLRLYAINYCTRQGWEACFNKCPFHYLFLYANSPPDMKKVVSSENFSIKFRPQKWTPLYLKLLLNSLDGAYADPTNRRRISDTFARAE